METLLCLRPSHGTGVRILSKHVCPTNQNTKPNNPFYPIARDIYQLLNDPQHDDGSYAPLFIRLAWHSAATYDINNNTGGCNGATMRFSPECDDVENIGLKKAIDVLADRINSKHPWISHSDTWVLASYVALAVTGGPALEFLGGRIDASSPTTNYIPPNGLLPNPEAGLEPGIDDHGRINGYTNQATQIRAIFARMGFIQDEDIVALVAGGHAYGRCHSQISGYQGPWTATPTIFSNEFASDLVGDEWMYVEANDEKIPAPVRPCCGKRQFNGKKYMDNDGGAEPPPQMMLPSDMALLWDEGFKQHLVRYAGDEGALKHDFGVCFKRLTELGCSNLGLGLAPQGSFGVIVSLDKPMDG